jgi:antitoxin ParD1/3/4
VHSRHTKRVGQRVCALTERAAIGIVCQCPAVKSHMPTRNVVLTDHQALLVERLVTSGRYQNASEVLREGLRLVEQRETENAHRIEALRTAAQLGVEDIDAGRFKTFDSKASMRSHLNSVFKKAKSAP